MLAGAMADAETLQRQSEMFTADQLTYMIQLLREAKLRARRDTTGRIALELAVIKMSRLSDLVPVVEALEELSGSGGAVAGPRAAPAADQSAVGALRRISQKLKDRTGKNQTAPAGERRPPPEGISEAKYRQIVACADDPDAARQALQEEPLRKAFVEADKALGLNPVRLGRRAPPHEKGGPPIRSGGEETEEEAE